MIETFADSDSENAKNAAFSRFGIMDRLPIFQNVFSGNINMGERVMAVTFFPPRDRLKILFFGGRISWNNRRVSLTLKIGKTLQI